MQKGRRILVISHGHPQLSAGGAELAAYALFRELQQLGNIRAWFLAWKEPDEPDAPTLSLFRGRPEEILLTAGEFDRFHFAHTAPEVADMLEQLLRRLDPDIIHLHHYMNIGLDILDIARRLKPSIRIVVTLHEFLAICHHYGLMVRADNGLLCQAASPCACHACFPAISQAAFAYRRRRIGALLEHADMFIAPSRFLMHRYVDWGIPAARIVHVPNGTAPVVAPPQPRDRPAGAGCNVFGFFGQMHRFKGLLDLLLAADRLGPPASHALTGMRLVIHGAYLELNEPGYVSAVAALLRKHAGWISFHGQYTQRDLYRLMAAVDWVVVPSIWWENAPLVVEEALAHRRPVLCSDVGGLAEKVRPGLDGYHFRMGRPASLAALLAELCNNPQHWHRLHATLRVPPTTAQVARDQLIVYDELAQNVDRITHAHKKDVRFGNSEVSS